MNKKLIAIILISSSFMGFCGYVFYQTFYKYQSDVDQILAEIPAEDKELPPNVLKVFRNTKEVNNIGDQTVNNIWTNIRNRQQDISITEWRLYGAIWAILLPIRIGEKEKFGYFANRVYFSGKNEIYSFKSAAKFYFNKDWKDISEDEVLVLLTITKNPSSFSRTGGTELFNQKLKELVEINHKNSKPSL